MQITLRQPVHALDGPFGELGDIVVDPRNNDVTHLIVEPHNRHYQARLVPLSLVEVDEDVVTVQLDLEHLRALEAVAESDYLPISQPIELGDRWDVGIEHIRAMPHNNYDWAMIPYGPATMTNSEGYVSVGYDRVPRGECEIRHESRVVGADGRLLGLVNGVIVDDDHIEGVVVQTGVIGLRHNVAVPISTVSKVRHDEITLTLNRHTFRRLTPLDEPDGGHDSAFAAAEHRVAGAVKHGASALRSKLGRH